MQWNDVAKDWTAFTPRILTRWPQMDEDKVLDIDGDQDRFIGYLTSVKNDDRVAAQMELSDWLMGEQPADVMMDETKDNARILASGQNMPAGEDPSDDDRRFGDDGKADTPVGRTE